MSTVLNQLTMNPATWYGYLIEPAHWNGAILDYFAEQEAIDLGENMTLYLHLSDHFIRKIMNILR